MKKFLLLAVSAVLSLAAAAQGVTPPPYGTLVVNADFEDGGTPFTNGTVIALQCLDTNGGLSYYLNGGQTKSATFSYANLYRVVTINNGRFKLQNVLNEYEYIGNDGGGHVAMVPSGSAETFTAAIVEPTDWTTKPDTVNGGTNTVRFTTKGDNYLNANAQNSIPQYTAGTGGYSIWYVYTFTAEEIETIEAIENEVIPDYSTWTALSRTGWTVSGCSQQDKNAAANKDGGFKDIIDGNNNTFWHASWATGHQDNTGNHYLIFDLGEGEHTADGFGYLPKQAASATDAGNGYVTEYAIYFTNEISETVLGTTCGPNDQQKIDASSHQNMLNFLNDHTPAVEGTFDFEMNDKQITCPTENGNAYRERTAAFQKTAKGRYCIFLIKNAIGSQANTIWGNCAEFNLYTFRGNHDYTTGLEGVDKTSTIARSRYTSALNISDNAGHSGSVTDLQASGVSPICFDRTESVTMITNPGATITITPTQNMDWMHKYAYVDWDKNGFLYANPDTYLNSSNHTIKPGADIVAFDYYSGRNSNGTSANSNPQSASLSFTVPDNTKSGIYRVRYKVDWDSLDPNGNTQLKNNGAMEIVDDGGIIVDFTIEVIAELTVNVKHNDRILSTVKVSEHPNESVSVQTPDFFNDEPFITAMPRTSGSVDYNLTQLVLPFKHTETTDNMIYQAVQIHSNKTAEGYTWTFSEADSDNIIETKPADVATNDYSDTQLWAFVGNMADGFKIYNKAAGTEMWLYGDDAHVKVGTTDEKSSWKPYVNSVNLANDTYCCFKAEGTNYINMDVAIPDALSYWSSADEGSSCKFIAPSEPMLPAAAACEFNYSGPANAVGAIDYNGMDFSDAADIIAAATADKYDLDAAEALRDLIARYSANVSFAEIEPNGYYRIRNILFHDEYLYTSATDDNIYSRLYNPEEGNGYRKNYHTIFKFEPVAGQTDRYYLQSQGLYVGHVYGADPSSLHGPVQVSDVADRGEYSLVTEDHDNNPDVPTCAAFGICDNTQTDYNFLHQGGDAGSGDYRISAWRQFAHGSHFYVLKAEHIDVDLLSELSNEVDNLHVGFGYFPFPVYAEDEDTQLYYIIESTHKETEEPLLTYVGVKSVPANTAFMIGNPNEIKVTLAIGEPSVESEVESQHNVVRRAADETTETDGETSEENYENVLRGFVRRNQVDANNYIIGQTTSGDFGLVKTIDPAYVEGNYVYLPSENLSDNLAAVDELPLVHRGNTTRIVEINGEQPVHDVNVIYDLQGRRLSAPVKGINIINGKKVFVK